MSVQQPAIDLVETMCDPQNSNEEGITLNLPSKIAGQAQFLPLQKGQQVVIVGPNGSGKSSFGQWIQQQNPNNVYRICAERHNSFQQTQKVEAIKEALVITDNRSRMQAVNLPHSDYDQVLKDLFSRDTAQAIVERHQIKERQPSLLDKVVSLTNQVIDYATISLNLDPSKLNLQLRCRPTENPNSDYSATEMSDGEKHILYLIAKCLLIPSEFHFVVIDEPEIHLHPALMRKLWGFIEISCPELIFIYITHDLDFAAEKNNAVKILVNSYDKTTSEWDYDIVENQNDFPESLYLKVLGSRKPVLFVEGGSDIWVYEALYPEYLVLPCGGGDHVVQYTTAFNRMGSVHRLKLKGLIDRDYRTDEEISRLEENQIYCLEVALLENLLCVEELLKYVASHQSQPENIVNQVIEKITTKHREELKQQIALRSIDIITRLLNKLSLTGQSKEDIENSYNYAVSKIDISQVYQSSAQKHDQELNFQDILKIFKTKGLPGFADSIIPKYKDFVRRKVQSDPDFRKQFVGCLQKYVPTIDEDSEKKE